MIFIRCYFKISHIVVLLERHSCSGLKEEKIDKKTIFYRCLKTGIEYCTATKN